jgi:wyosine [tRNA(Phe)-imidazoG37] synthetase (radical SAM superfamily)
VTIPLKPGVTYGPVRSRRLGSSLGINLWPGVVKVCSFNCVYCQYGKTTTADAARCGGGVLTVSDVVAAVEGALETLAEAPSWLTFSGNGEPTLHPQFSAIVDAIVELRDRELPEARTAVLSCSTELVRPEVRASLQRLDARIMKLDVGSEALLRSFNRPIARVTLQTLTRGLAELEDVTIQTMLAAGSGGNADAAAVEDWIARVLALRPRAVQLYSLDRPHASRALEVVDHHTLEALAARLRGLGIDASAF